MSNVFVSATLTQPKKEQIQLTSVTDVAYTCTPSLLYTELEPYEETYYYLPDENEEWIPTLEENATIKQVIYSWYAIVGYSWSFSDDKTSSSKSGTKNFFLSNDSFGKCVTIWGKVKMECCIQEETYEYRRDDPEKSWIYNPDGYDSSSSDSFFIDSNISQCNIYTHPGNFTQYNFTANETPVCGGEGLTEDKINAWCDHCEKYLKWKNQNGTLSEDIINLLQSCHLTSKSKYVTASWYNNQAKACGLIDGIMVTEKVKVNDVIKASLFHELGQAISWDNN